MSRSKIRERIFLMLFRIEFHEGDELNEQLSNFLQEVDPLETGNNKALSEEDSAQIEEKYHLVMEHIEEIDKLINERTEGWTTNRMGKVDLAIIRLAIYEILFDDNVPVSVAINEAVELAKKFGTDESSSFVNGVLSRINDK